MAVDEEERYVGCCLERILDGQAHAVVFADLSPRLCLLGSQAFRMLLSGIVKPKLSAMHFKAPKPATQPKSEIVTWLLDQWQLFHIAAGVLADLTASEPWGGKSLSMIVTARVARELLTAL